MPRPLRRFQYNETTRGATHPSENPSGPPSTCKTHVSNKALLPMAEREVVRGICWSLRRAPHWGMSWRGFTLHHNISHSCSRDINYQTSLVGGPLSDMCKGIWRGLWAPWGSVTGWSTSCWIIPQPQNEKLSALWRSGGWDIKLVWWRPRFLGRELMCSCLWKKLGINEHLMVVTCDLHYFHSWLAVFVPRRQKSAPAAPLNRKLPQPAAEGGLSQRCVTVCFRQSLGWRRACWPPPCATLLPIHPLSSQSLYTVADQRRLVSYLPKAVPASARHHQ